MSDQETEQPQVPDPTSEEDRSFTRRIVRFLNQQELSPEERRDVLEDLFVFGKGSQTPYLVRQGVLLILSTIIATAGLISDSAAVVIGAMLVAPLMNPVMAAAGAVVMGWPKRFYQALWLVLAMAAGALLISSLLTLASPELVIMPEQVLARTRPTFWDLIIALAAGAAGAYTITRKESSAIPGVAVAVALLPPLASTGILFTSGDEERAVRALVLFLTNFVAMVLAGAITFLVVGVAPATARRRSAAFIKNKLFLFLVLTGAICVPLWFYSEKVIFNAEYQAARSDVLQDWLVRYNYELLDVEIFREERRLQLQLAGPTPPTSRLEELHQAILDRHDVLERESFQIDYTWTQKVSGSWPPEEQTASDAASNLRRSVTEILLVQWHWVRTDLSGGESTTPDPDDPIQLVIEPKGDVEITANCGRLRGNAHWARQGLTFEFTTAGNLFRRKCRRDEAMTSFINDLESVRDAEQDGELLRLQLRDGAGVMTLRRK